MNDGLKGTTGSRTPVLKLLFQLRQKVTRTWIEAMSKGGENNNGNRVEMY